MRVCDKCHKSLLHATFRNLKDSSEVDLCIDCYQIFADWVYNLGRKKENEPIDTPKTTRRRK